MKTIIKITLSLVLALCMVLPMTAIAATPDYKDVPKKHWAYEYVMRLAEEGIMHGMVEGVYFNKHGEVRSKELLAVLYRMTGEEEYEELVPTQKYEDTWYKNAVLWAVNNSIAGFYFILYSAYDTSGIFSCILGEGSNYEEYLRYVDEQQIDPRNVGFQIGRENADTVVTRSDVVVAFYRYAAKVLEKDVSSKGDIAVYTDSEKFPVNNDSSVNRSLYKNAHKMYREVVDEISDNYTEDTMTQIWLWAIDAGIIEGYPDGTLRPDATITRAEFAAMLTRFMDYVK